MSHLLGEGRKREEAAGGPVKPLPGGDRGSSSVSSASTAMAMPGGPTHLHSHLSHHV